MHNPNHTRWMWLSLAILVVGAVGCERGVSPEVQAQLASLDTLEARVPHEDGFWSAGRGPYWRGRVLQRLGRGDDAAASWRKTVREYPLSYYMLLALARLDAMESIDDGFTLAEMDLEQRREGELLGLSQSGLPPLRVASLARPSHQELSLRAREIAEQIVDKRGSLSNEHAALENEITGGWLKQVGAGEVLRQDLDA